MGLRTSIFQAMAISASIATFSPALAQEACGTYTVKADDTLGDIAWSAYGSGDYQMLFDANRDRLGGNPAILEAGLELQIPCPDGALIVAQSDQSGGGGRARSKTSQRSLRPGCIYPRTSKSRPLVPPTARPRTRHCCANRP